MNNPLGQGEGGAVGANPSRRAALKAGAVGGALLWTVPAVQALGLSAAHADDPSGPPPPPPPPPADTCAPSFGVAVFRRAGSYYPVKVESDGTLHGVSPQQRSGLESQLGVTLVTTTAHLGDFTGGVNGDGSYILWSVTAYDYVGGTVKDGNGNGLTDKDFEIKVLEDQGVWFYKLAKCD